MALTAVPIEFALSDQTLTRVLAAVDQNLAMITTARGPVALSWDKSRGVWYIETGLDILHAARFSSELPYISLGDEDYPNGGMWTLQSLKLVGDDNLGRPHVVIADDDSCQSDNMLWIVRTIPSGAPPGIALHGARGSLNQLAALPPGGDFGCFDFKTWNGSKWVVGARILASVGRFAEPAVHSKLRFFTASSNVLTERGQFGEDGGLIVGPAPDKGAGTVSVTNDYYVGDVGLLATVAALEARVAALEARVAALGG